jgi:hypothetical protein
MTADTTPPTAANERDWLDAALVADGRDHAASYVDDAGFTARVMAALPAPAAVAPRWRRPAVAALWTVAAAGAAIALPGTVLDVGREAFRLLAAQPVSVAQIAAMLAAAGAATWGAAAWALRAD